MEVAGNNHNSASKCLVTQNHRAGSVDAEAEAQRSPASCNINSYRPPNFMWPSD